MLRNLFGSKRDEVTGDWRRLHNEELHSLYCTHYCGVKTGHVSCTEEKSIHDFGRKHDGKIPLQRQDVCFSGMLHGTNVVIYQCLGQPISPIFKGPLKP